MICQWVLNLRLELGHQLHSEPVRTTEFAPAHLSATDQQALSPAPAQGYGPAAEALPWKAGRFSGRDFVPQPDGTLRCPAGQSLRVHERRREVDGSLRVVYAASIRSCRPCPLRDQCQWQGRATKKPRQVSVLLHPLIVGSAPLLWKDWSRRLHRRVHAAACRPTPGGADGATPLCQPRPLVVSPLPCAAGALSSLVARAAGSECTSPRSFPGHDQAVRGPRRLRNFPRPVNSLTGRRTVSDCRLHKPRKGPLCLSQGRVMACFFLLPLILLTFLIFLLSTLSFPELLGLCSQDPSRSHTLWLCFLGLNLVAHLVGPPSDSGNPPRRI
jgi:hypothetical protein